MSKEQAEVAVKAKAVEVGRITTADLDGETNVTPFGLLISFSSGEEVRAALAAGRVEFTFMD